MNASQPLLPSISRRRFLRTSIAATAAWQALPSGVLAAPGRPGANNRFVVGHIGTGGMGMNHVRNMVRFQSEGKVRVAAVCDADENFLITAAGTVGGEVATYRDYRRLIERKDLDAVVIATPDHWHATMTVHACQMGKHVYVEKPSSVTVREGRAMVEAARANRVAVQVGAQARTALGGWHTCRAIRNGIVGRVNKVTCWHYANPVDEKPLPDGPPPEGLDWDLWVGPLPWREFNRRYHPANFRWFLEIGGGQIRDRGAHQFSTILWCMNADQQTSFTVEATGRAPLKGIWDCPVTMDVTYTFKDPDWTLVWGQPGDKVGETEFGNVFWGDRGRLVLEWEGGYRPANPEAIHFKLPPGGEEVYRTDEYEDFNMNHKADWFKSIREGHLRPAVDIEIGHRTATLCILGNLSYMLGRKLVWDGDKEEVVGDEQANRLLGRPNRYPYVI
ncbi:MAG: Gfo/Idh/MocA family oxidoreductase [Verrucomicrobiales bacterium]|nr:Gfo/Idh/MocA family oxidoreductase [Verrucomicrobiales bacterium]MCP5527109.1 Gfo/Idh/MocA family oxidoreductase [Verrucomicrobiales bacterium]